MLSFITHTHMQTSGQKLKNKYTQKQRFTTNTHKSFSIINAVTFCSPFPRTPGCFIQALTYNNFMISFKHNSSKVSMLTSFFFLCEHIETVISFPLCLHCSLSPQSPLCLCQAACSRFDELYVVHAQLSCPELQLLLQRGRG